MPAVPMVRRLAVRNLQIVDTTPHPDQLAVQLVSGRDYELRVCVRNQNADDKLWYDNIQVRVVPVELSVQFFADSSYSQAVPRFQSDLFSLRSNTVRWFTIPFRWTGNQPIAAPAAKFDIGIYAHELPILSAWKKLAHPI